MRTTKFFISILTVAALTVTSAFSVSADNAAEYGNYDSSFTAQPATERVVPSADPDFEEMTLEEFKTRYPAYKGIKDPRSSNSISPYAVTPDPGYVTSKYSGPFVWKQVGSKWYLYASNGATKVSTGGWYQENNYWYFLYPAGAKKYDGTTAAGEMAVGWEKIGNYWYYFNEYGQMSTYWRLISGVYYYFSPDGVNMVPGYPEGGMVTGEHYLPYAKNASQYFNYYFDKNGVMQDWTYPLSSGGITISSPFNDPNNGNHHGLDFKASTGTYIYAATNGTVKFAGFNSSMGYAVIMKSDVLDPNDNYLFDKELYKYQ